MILKLNSHLPFNTSVLNHISTNFDPFRFDFKIPVDYRVRPKKEPKIANNVYLKFHNSLNNFGRDAP